MLHHGGQERSAGPECGFLRAAEPFAREGIEGGRNLARRDAGEPVQEALIALPNDVSRTEPDVKRAFESVLKVLIDIFEQGLERKGDPARQRALAMTALCVGGMVLARSVEDRALADELRQAAKGVALSLGRWPSAEEAPAAGHGGRIPAS